MKKLSNRDKYLRSKYGITEADYSVLLKKFDGCCWICRRPPKTRKLAVDHNHKTGKVRGLLCHRCNRGLQFYSDSPVRLVRAAEYLIWALTTESK